jgi:hypothetical protein
VLLIGCTTVVPNSISVAVRTSLPPCSAIVPIEVVRIGASFEPNRFRCHCGSRCRPSCHLAGHEYVLAGLRFLRRGLGADAGDRHRLELGAAGRRKSEEEGKGKGDQEEHRKRLAHDQGFSLESGLRGRGPSLASLGERAPDDDLVSPGMNTPGWPYWIGLFTHQLT